MNNFEKNFEIIKIQIDNIKDQRRNIWLGLLASFGGLGALFPGLSNLANATLMIIIAVIAVILFLILRDDNISIQKLIKKLEDENNDYR